MNGRCVFVNAPASCTIGLIDFQGRTVFQKLSSAGEREIALGRLNPGINVLRISEKTGKEIA
jgi:hypothetical protein